MACPAPERSAPRSPDAERTATAAPLAIPERLHGLDTLRGLAAFAVVLNHWKHFAYDGTDGAPALDRSVAPFYGLLGPLYEHGWIAVDFFFSLSGFVFFWLYGDAVRRRETGLGSFAWRRVSRLYPLHLVTLVAVLGLQLVARARTGSFWVYPENDAYHFLLHLGFASGWGLAEAHSFNAPVWSVSIEVLLYALFFGFCLSRRSRDARLVALVAAAGLAVRFVNPNLGRGIFSFFLGGLTFHAYRGIVGRADWRRFVAPVLVLLGLLVLGACLELRGHWLEERVGVLADLARGHGGGATLAKVAEKVPALLVTGVVFPVTILALSLAETARPKGFAAGSFLGAWSYSAYLLHFPLQLAVVLGLGAVGLDAAAMNRPIAVPLFFGLLFAACHLSYTYVERPAQRLLRKLF